jgi:HAD superfamily phosphatase (TIGR01668 family)
MLRFLTPHLQIDSVLALGPDQLRRHGLEGLLLDLDNTLKDHPATTFPDSVVEWARALRADGIRLCLFSNSRPRKAERFAGTLDIPFVAQAFKPFPWACAEGIRLLGVPRQHVGLVGDQVFADVLAGRLAGLFTVLVPPLSSVEPWFTRIKRPLERRVLRWIKGDTSAPPQVS